MWHHSGMSPRRSFSALAPILALTMVLGPLPTGAAGAPAGSDAPNDAVPAITRALERFQNALAARDTLVIADSYTERAVSLLQNNPVRTGRDAIVQRSKRS